MRKYTTLALALLAACALCLGYSLVRACISGAIDSAQDRCLEAPACNFTRYFLDSGLTRPAYGALCETCSTYYQGCDVASTNSLATNELWAQFYQAPYFASTNGCGDAMRQGPALYIGNPGTNYQTLDSGCGELTPTASRPIQRPIFLKLQ
jgi:hypothetical protein